LAENYPNPPKCAKCVSALVDGGGRSFSRLSPDDFCLARHHLAHTSLSSHSCTPTQWRPLNASKGLAPPQRSWRPLIGYCWLALELYTELVDTHAEHECQDQLNDEPRWELEVDTMDLKRFDGNAMHCMPSDLAENYPNPPKCANFVGFTCCKSSLTWVRGESCGR
jgi:hypothetical protein